MLFQDIRESMARFFKKNTIGKLFKSLSQVSSKDNPWKIQASERRASIEVSKNRQKQLAKSTSSGKNLAPLKRSKYLPKDTFAKNRVSKERRNNKDLTNRATLAIVVLPRLTTNNDGLNKPNKSQKPQATFLNDSKSTKKPRNTPKSMSRRMSVAMLSDEPRISKKLTRNSTNIIDSNDSGYPKSPFNYGKGSPSRRAKMTRNKSTNMLSKTMSKQLSLLNNPESEVLKSFRKSLKNVRPRIEREPMFTEVGGKEGDHEKYPADAFGNRVCSENYLEVCLKEAPIITSCGF